MTTDDRDSKCSLQCSSLCVFIYIADYTISTLSKYYPTSCDSFSASNAIDFIHVLCISRHDHVFTIRAYDINIPHDLLMITVVDDETKVLEYFTYYPVGMVIIENKNTYYIGHTNCKCFWKIENNNSQRMANCPM